MKLFIIGNGFDIGHDLDTRYWDFRTYLDAIDWEFLMSFEEHYNIYTETRDKDKKQILWNEFETNLANLDDDEIIDMAENMDLGLDGGDIFIEETLEEYYNQEYNCISILKKYLKRWVRTICIRDIKQKTSLIKKSNDDFYITFNYTSVLETVYKIKSEKIIHIHGSLRQDDDDPILGHTNIDKINEIVNKISEAKESFNEKKESICHALKNYYERTYKNTNDFMWHLNILQEMDIDQIIVIGHSLAENDISYFHYIDILTKEKVIWKVFFHVSKEREKMYNNLAKVVEANRIKMLPDTEFFNI